VLIAATLTGRDVDYLVLGVAFIAVGLIAVVMGERFVGPRARALSTDARRQWWKWVGLVWIAVGVYWIIVAVH
jgi:hypothetical protein